MSTSRVFTVLVALTLSLAGLTAQTIVTTGYRSEGTEARVALFAFDAAGTLTQPAPGTVSVTVNGSTVPSTTTVDAPAPERPISLYVMADASSTTAGNGANALIKAGAAAATTMLTDGADQVGLARFSNVPTMLHGLTANQSSYTGAVTEIVPRSGFDLNEALFGGTMGGFSHLQNAPGGRVLLLLVDGSSEIELERAISAASTFKTQVYVIGINVALHPHLRQLAEASGGAWIDGLQVQADVEAHVKGFVAHAKRLRGSTVAVTNPDPCTPTFTMEITSDGVTRVVTATTAVTAVSALEWLPNGLDFGTDASTKTLTATVTARGPEDIRISAAVSTDAAFVIEDPVSAPETLAPGASRTFRIRYTGGAQGTFGAIQLTATAGSNGTICSGDQLYLRAGALNTGDRLQVTSPNGGETYTAGEGPVLITWTNTLPSDVVRIEATTNNGTSWTSITEQATGLSYAWRPGPDPTTQGRIRIQRTAVPDSDVVTLVGHRSPIYSTLFANDGRWALTGGHDYTIRLWDANTGIPLRQLGSHSNWVWDLALHPDGLIVASGSHDASVRFWDLATNARIGTYLADSKVWSVAYSPDGGTLAVGSDASLTLVNTSDLTRRQTLSLPTVRCQSVAYSQDGAYVIAAEGNVARMRRADDLNTIVHTFAGHTAEIYAVAISPDGRTVVTGGADFTVRTWSATTGQAIAQTAPATASILDLDVSANGQNIASAGADGTVKIWRLTDLQPLNSFAGHQGSVYSATYDEAGDRIVSGATDYAGRVWNVTRASLVEDASDAPFTIRGGTAATSDANHGTVRVGQSIDKTTPMLSNVGSDTLIVHAARIVSGNVDDFTLEIPAMPVRLAPGQQLSVTSTFKPSASGARNALVVFETGVGTATSFLEGEADAPDVICQNVLPTNTSFICDFGRHLAGQTVDDTTLRFTVPSGGQPLSITRTALVGLQAGAFSILSGGGAFTVTPTQPREFVIRFEPLEVARYGARLELTRSDGSILVFRLYGEGSGDARIATSNQSLLYTTDPCTASTIIQQASVRNDGSSPLQIYNITVAGTHAGEFTVTSPAASAFPLTLQPQQVQSISVAFSPTIVGPKDARLVITSNGTGNTDGTLQIPIVARRDSVGYELTLPSVSFENVNENESAIQYVSILNTGTVSLRWSVQPIDLGDFRIESIEPSITPPGGTSTFTVRFKGGTPGQIYTANHTFADSVCGRTQSLSMRATVKSYIGATISADVVRANIGTEVEVPIRISDRLNFDRTQVTEIHARLRVNGTILTPVGLEHTFDNGDRTFTVTLPIPTTGDVMTRLRFTTTWGNDTSSVIAFDSVWVADTLLIRTRDGEVVLDDLCREGGPRLFLRRQPTPGITTQVIPHPVQDQATVVIDVVEQGPTIVELVDVTGRIVQTLVDRELSPGRYLLPLDASFVEIGSYMITMRTRTQQLSNRISVVR